MWDLGTGLCQAAGEGLWSFPSEGCGEGASRSDQALPWGSPSHLSSSRTALPPALPRATLPLGNMNHLPACFLLLHSCCEGNTCALDPPLRGHQCRLCPPDLPVPLGPIYVFLFLFFLSFLGLTRHMEVPRLGVQAELQLPAYTAATATATWDLSCICDLHHSSRNTRPLTH